MVAIAAFAFLAWHFATCSNEDEGSATAIATAPAETTSATSPTDTPAVETSSATQSPAVTRDAEWPPKLGLPAIDAALDALRSGDGVAFLNLVQPASTACTTATGAGGPPKCPPGTADGTVIEYVPYFECDGWGSPDAATARFTDDTTYPLAVLAWDPPVALRAGAAPPMTHADLLVRRGFGESEPASDARPLTTLAFDGDSVVQIVPDCGAYSEAAFPAGSLPEVPEGAQVLWRAYPTP